MKKQTILLYVYLAVSVGTALADATVSEPVLPKFRALSPTDIQSVRLNGEGEAARALPLLCDGRKDTVAVINGCSAVKNNEFVFQLSAPAVLSGLQCSISSTIGGGEFALYVSDDDSQWGAPVRRGDFSWSNPFVSFPPVRGRYVKLAFVSGFQQKESSGPVEKPKNFNLRISEVTFYSPAFIPSVAGLSDHQSGLLADGSTESRIRMQCPAQLRLSVNPEQSVGGISLFLGTELPVDVDVQVSARNAQSGETNIVYRGRLKTPAAWSSVDDAVAQSLFFDPIKTDRLILDFSGAETAGFSLCELDLLAPSPEVAAPAQCTVRINPKRVLRTINPRVFGANIEYWLDDDAALNDEHFARLIRQTGITVLRYPGGTESDRYLWKEHRLYDKKYWPFVDGPQTTDTDEMFAFAAKTGTEVILCVNTEYAFYEKDVEKGAAYAAEWVRYCREKNYPVKYWTIGNEPYWKANFGAKQFAELVRVYAKKMKAENPDIVIAVAGEVGIDFVAKLDAILPEGRTLIQELQDRREALQIDPTECEKQLSELRKQYKNPSPDLWWPTILNEVGKYIDMVEVHLYPGEPGRTIVTGEMTDQLQKLKQYARQRTGHPCELAVTEWNLFNLYGTGRESQGMEQALYIGEFLGRLIEGGVDIGTFWPITMRGNWIQKAFFVEKYHDILPSQLGFALCSRNLSGELVASSSDNRAYYTIASRDDRKGETTVLIFGRPSADAEDGVQVSLPLPDRTRCAHVEMFYAPDKQSYSIQRLMPFVEQEDGRIFFAMPRYAMAAVKIIDQ